MTPPLNRRRFLAITAAACTIASSRTESAVPEALWQGRALGAAASLRLSGVTAENASPVFEDIEAELNRLESIFSLYRLNSEISRLNAAGRLSSPSLDLLEVLSYCARLHNATGGAFDPTVQPVFEAVARSVGTSRLLSEHDLADALGRVGWDGVRFEASEVQLIRPGAALTLNGIAQGFITDKIVELLKACGFGDVLVDMGEIAARGVRSDGEAWRAGIADPQGRVHKRLRLSDRALATSAPKGTVLDMQGAIGHIFDPTSGREADWRTLVSVSAPRAVLADGLSTALCLLPLDQHATVVRRFPGARIELTA